MHIKKYFLLSSLVVFLLTAGFGCQGMSTAQVQATKPVSLEYWTVADDVDALQKEIAAFRAARPYVTVNLRQLRADEIYQRLIEALAEDHGPDIISVQNRRVGEFLTKLVPMPATVNDVTLSKQKNLLGTIDTTVSTQVRNMINLSQLDQQYVKAVRDDVVHNGQIVGLPLSMDMVAVYYNKDLLDRSGVPEPPKTWTEFQDAVRKITRYDKKTGQIIQSGTALGTGNNVPSSDDLLYLLFRQSKVNFVSKGGQAIFSGTPEAAGQVMDFYTDFANPTRDTYTWNSDQGNALDAFVNGKVGFYFGYSYDFPTIRSRAPQFEYHILPLFQLNPDNQVNVANYWIQTVLTKSKNQNEAWNLVDFLTHSKATKDYLDQTGRPTAMRAYIADQKTKPELEPFVGQILTAENWYHGRDYASAQKAVQDMINEWITPPPDPNKAGDWRSSILNRGAQRVNQTL